MNDKRHHHRSRRSDCPPLPRPCPHPESCGRRVPCRQSPTVTLSATAQALHYAHGEPRHRVSELRRTTILITLNCIATDIQRRTEPFLPASSSSSRRCPFQQQSESSSHLSQQATTDTSSFLPPAVMSTAQDQASTCSSAGASSSYTQVKGTYPERVILHSRSRKAVVVGAGADHSFAVDADGSTWGRGHNGHGQTGTGIESHKNGTTLSSTRPRCE